MSIVQGGPGFPFLHRHVYMSLCTNVWSPVAIATEAIPDYSLQYFVDKVISFACSSYVSPLHIKFLFLKISSADCEETLRRVLEDEKALTHLSEAGFTKPLSLVQLSDRREIVSTLLTFHLFIKVKAVMDQFKEGLEEAGLLHYMKKYHDLMTPLFVNETSRLTASKQYR